ncbi:hypothetical protein [Mycobacterium xenopi]|uniref:Uncharacterized protein n=1 Tax=Mycobacterium xenopi TaxID=1789 RepID=A0A2X1S496_MYCXE|nr:hypothetical protein [Mycobacterium xenopi]ORX21627.1 hypothetical protein AWC32_21695 [Mycobacterium xenopi]BBU22130.1 hypothetical protein MYXE_19200 [Mycobacterium xenopi]SPX77968.1 Uncharacterised protein [Mycobacterium xenopi]SPX91664.1 Uncharacterised protein [Mycobacterium xenopi]
MRFNDWLRLPCDLLTEYGCYPIRFAQAVAEGVALGLRRASSPAAADVSLAAAGDHQPRQPSSPPRFGNPKVLRAAAIQLDEWSRHPDCEAPYYCRALSDHLRAASRNATDPHY